MSFVHLWRFNFVVAVCDFHDDVDDVDDSEGNQKDASALAPYWH